MGANRQMKLKNVGVPAASARQPIHTSCSRQAAFDSCPPAKDDGIMDDKKKVGKLVA